MRFTNQNYVGTFYFSAALFHYLQDNIRWKLPLWTFPIVVFVLLKWKGRIGEP